MAWHRRRGGEQRWCSGDGLPEEGSSGGADKTHGEGPFYSCEHWDRRDGSGWRLALSRAQTALASTRGCRHAARQTAAGDLCGDDVKGVCPYDVGSGALDRGWRWTGPRGAHERASVPWLHARRWAGVSAELGRPRRKRPTTIFQFKSLFQLNKSAKENKNRKILVDLTKSEILHEDRFEYLAQLSYWTR
jgi:hypothetical protein